MEAASTGSPITHFGSLIGEKKGGIPSIPSKYQHPLAVVETGVDGF